MQPKLQLTAFSAKPNRHPVQKNLNRFLSMLETLPLENSSPRKRGERDPEK